MNSDNTWPVELREAAGEFLGNLRSMATGSYLTPDDRMWWEPPYPPEAVDQVELVLGEMAAAVISGGSAIEAGQIGVQKMQEISDANGGLILDSEELRELLGVIAVLARMRGENADQACEVVREIVEE